MESIPENTNQIRRLYYTSDTHHEMLSNNSSRLIDIIPIEATADELASGLQIRNFLALCGDIGNPYDPKYEQFLERHSARFEHVFVISGNHEYYSNTKQHPIPKIDEKIHEVCSKFSNVHFLQQTIFTIDSGTENEVGFAGCTLWTPVNETAESVMRDYQHIYVEDPDRNIGSLVTVKNGSNRMSNTFGTKTGRKKYMRANRRLVRWRDILELHGDMTDWLELVVTLPTKMIILTHHAPSEVMLGNRGGSASSEIMPSKNDGVDFSMYYAAKCDYLFVKPVICWISGHTHYCFSKEINGIPCLSNCWGYSNQKTGVDPTKYFTF